MSIQVGDNFKYLGKKPIDNRMQYATLSEMVSMSEASLYEGCKAYVIETGKEYQYKSSNTVDVTTGKWRDTSVDLSNYYTKSETYSKTEVDTDLSDKQDNIQYSTMPDPSESYTNKIFQYIGATTEKFTNGKYYKCVNISEHLCWRYYELGYSEVKVWTIGKPSPIVLYSDRQCTSVRGYVDASYKNDTQMSIQFSGESWGKTYNRYSSEDYIVYEWQQVNPSPGIKVNGTEQSFINGYYDLPIPSEIVDLSDVQVGSSIANDDVLAWDSTEEKFVNKPQSGGGGGVSDFDDITNRPLESDVISIEDLDLPMPAKPIEYPILFDETGKEYQVGLYKRVDGKVKPIYRKNFYNLILKVDGTTAITTIDNSFEIIKYEVLLTSGSGKETNPFIYSSINYWCIWFNGQSLLGKGSDHYINKTFNLSLYYTKTTDEWKEV